MRRWRPPSGPARVEPVLDDVRTGFGLAVGLPGYLRRVIDFDRARELIRRRLRQRAADFLVLARRAIYEQAESPYRALLAATGCEMGDLERLVRGEGLEGALSALARRGVYLTVDEFKGRRPVARGSLRLQLEPAQFRNPLSHQHVVSRSGGSRGPRVPVPLDLENLYDRSLRTLLPILANGGAEWALAVWKVPGGALPTLLQHALRRKLPERWFLMLDPRGPRIPSRYRLSASLVHHVSRLAGRPLPAGENVSLGNPDPIVRWMTGVLERRETPHLDTFSGAAVELSRAARASGTDLQGAHFCLVGEPLTEARLATIRSTGAQVVSRYSTSETGPLASGCLRPSVVDDQHLLEDGHAVIRAGDAQAGTLPADALLVTSVPQTTSLVHLNVALGDRGDLDERACGCPLEPFGWTRHISGIRSYEKLTAHGMTFLDADVIRVLEQTLPSRFGGGPNDYQLVESSRSDGRPLLLLRVHPRVPAAEPAGIARVFLEAVAAGGAPQRLMSQVWRDARLIEVVREPPAISAGGKILHVVGAPGPPVPPRPSGAPTSR
jgi:hypothetical protein